MRAIPDIMLSIPSATGRGMRGRRWPCNPPSRRSLCCRRAPRATLWIWRFRPRKGSSSSATCCFPPRGSIRRVPPSTSRWSTSLISCATARRSLRADYLDRHLEFVRAEQALDEDAAMADAVPTLLYVNEFRSYVVTYTMGRRLVARCVNGTSHEDSWARYLALMQTPDTLLPCSIP